VLQAASLAKMTTPFKNHYAFGLSVDSVRGHKVVEHSGGIDGFNTHLAYYPDEKLTVVVLGNVNGGAPDVIASQLAGLVHGEKITLASERKEIALDPKVLARYTGAYRMVAGPIVLVTLDGNQLSSKLGNQGAIPIFPDSPTSFFMKVVDAQLEFSNVDAQGTPQRLTLHQNGRDAPMTRLSDAESKPLLDAAAAFAKRLKDQTAAPGTEAALRRMIGEIQRGAPNYELMVGSLAAEVRQQLPQIQPAVVQLGALQSLTFKGVGPGGADIFTAKFEKGSLEYRIRLSPDGKADNLIMRMP
jgi:hypothetical protein